MQKIWIIIFSAFILASCSLGSLDRGERAMMTLPSLQAGIDRPAPIHDHRLVVDFPDSEGRLDTYRIAVTTKDGNSDYYAHKRWVDFLPVIVQNSLAETLQNAGLYKFVKTDAHGLGDDLLLKPTIRKFEVLYNATQTDAPDIVIEMDFTLQDVPTGRRLKSFTLTSYSQASANQTKAIRAALDDAYKKIQIQLLDQLKS